MNGDGKALHSNGKLVKGDEEVLSCTEKALKADKYEKNMTFDLKSLKVIERL